MDTGPLRSPSVEIGKDNIFGREISQLLPQTIAPRRMKWFLINQGELEQFEDMDAGSSDYWTFGIAAVAVAVGLFGSSFTISSTFTLPQLVMFYLTPGVVGALGILATLKGTKERTAAWKKRQKEITRIKTESAIAVETMATRIIDQGNNLPEAPVAR